MKNKLPTHLNLTILMPDGFFFLPDLLLQDELLSVSVKGRKRFDNDDYTYTFKTITSLQKVVIQTMC